MVLLIQLAKLSGVPDELDINKTVKVFRSVTP